MTTQTTFHAEATIGGFSPYVRTRSNTGGIISGQTTPVGFRLYPTAEIAVREGARAYSEKLARWSGQI